MKYMTKYLFILLGFMFLMPVPMHADDDLDKQIHAIEIQLKDIANKTGKYAKMSAEKLANETAKLEKKLEKLIDKWEAEHGTHYKKSISNATKKAGQEIKKAGKEIKKATKKAVKELDKAIND